MRTKTQEVVDRAYWENKATKATIALVDGLLEIAKHLDPTLVLKYNKGRIGLSREGQPLNFVKFRPRKNLLRLDLKLPETDDLNTKIENSGIETLDYDKRWGRYRLRLTKRTM